MAGAIDNHNTPPTPPLSRSPSPKSKAVAPASTAPLAEEHKAPDLAAYGAITDAPAPTAAPVRALKPASGTPHVPLGISVAAPKALTIAVARTLPPQSPATPITAQVGAAPPTVAKPPSAPGKAPEPQGPDNQAALPKPLTFDVTPQTPRPKERLTAGVIFRETFIAAINAVTFVWSILSFPSKIMAAGPHLPYVGPLFRFVDKLGPLRAIAIAAVPVAVFGILGAVLGTTPAGPIFAGGLTLLLLMPVATAAYHATIYALERRAKAKRHKN